MNSRYRPSGPRLCIFVDLPVWREPGGWASSDAFLQFLAGFAPSCKSVTIVARVLPSPGVVIARASDEELHVIALPNYASIRTLLTTDVHMWSAVHDTLLRALDHADLVWLNFGHPISHMALQMVRRRNLASFAVLRGDYVQDARFHAPWGARTLSAVAMRALLRAFAFAAARASVPCLALTHREVNWLVNQGLRAARVQVSLIPTAILSEHSEVIEKSRDVLVVGRLDPVKGHDVLFKALTDLHVADNRLAKLTVVGEGPERAKLERLANRLGIAARVEFVGPLSPGPELWRVYGSARVLVIPSRTEGLPAVALEAMALSLPVVATAVGGLPDLLGGPAPLGWLVEPNDHIGLRRALELVLAGGAERSARLSRATASAPQRTSEASIATFLSAWRQWGFL